MDKKAQDMQLAEEMLFCLEKLARLERVAKERGLWVSLYYPTIGSTDAPAGVIVKRETETTSQTLLRAMVHRGSKARQAVEEKMASAGHLTRREVAALFGKPVREGQERRKRQRPYAHADRRKARVDRRNGGA